MSRLIIQVFLLISLLIELLELKVNGDTYTLEYNDFTIVTTATDTVPPASEILSGLTIIGPLTTVVGASPATTYALTLEGNDFTTALTAIGPVPPASELPSGLTVIGPYTTVVGVSPVDSYATYTIEYSDITSVITATGTVPPANEIPSGVTIIGPYTTVVGVSADVNATGISHPIQPLSSNSDSILFTHNEHIVNLGISLTVIVTVWFFSKL